MNMEVDHYAVLGLPSGEEGAKLSKEVIATAYRRKSKELHPDKRPGDPSAHADFLKLQASYEILKDKSKRKSFDDLVRLMNLDGLRRGYKRQRPEWMSGFQERERKRAAAQREEEQRARRNKFRRTEKVNTDAIRRAVFVCMKSSADIPVGRKGVQISCCKDGREIRVQAFSVEGVWVKLR